MKNIFAVAVVIAAFTTGAVVAAEPAQAVSIEKQLQDMKKMVGAGEMSSKEYNKRKEALMASAQGQQAAETMKK